jgi:probable HAF family extracellular repeat protein
VATLALAGLCATPLASGAQEQPQIADSATGSEPPTTQHHHYKLIDIGTFGGPQSYFNDLNLTDVFNYGTAFYAFAQILNVQGTLVGFADTRTPDPYSANPEFCYVLDCFITHAYAWRNGARSDLGTLPGGASSAAFWINSHGWITGNSQIGETDPLIPGLPELRAVIWKDGQIRDLGTLGGSSSFSQAINDHNQVTGLALNDVPDPFSFFYQFLYCLPFSICPANATQTRGFEWDEEEGMQDIGTLGGPDAFPSLINNHGQIAGFSYTDSIPHASNGGFPTLHPFLWEKGKGMKDLGTLGGTTTASVNGLNERGEVVGGSYLPEDQVIQPFLWDGRTLINLVAPPFLNTVNGEAAWINENGEVVGLAGTPGVPGPCSPAPHAFLWRKGVITDLGSLAGFEFSGATFINSKSQIVGAAFSCESAPSAAFLWENGSMVDLNTLVPANSPLHLFTASFIDDRERIGAFGALANGDMHAVLLIPCDEGHPNVEGCDYSLVDARSTAKRLVSKNVSH